MQKKMKVILVSLLVLVVLSGYACQDTKSGGEQKSKNQQENTKQTMLQNEKESNEKNSSEKSNSETNRSNKNVTNKNAANTDDAEKSERNSESTVETGVSALEREFPEKGMKTLILYDSKDTRLEEIAVEIQRKMGGVIHKLSEKEDNSLSDSNESTQEMPELAVYELILIGGLNQSGQISSSLKQFLEATDFQGKRVSPFWLSDSQEQSAGSVGGSDGTSEESNQSDPMKNIETEDEKNRVYEEQFQQLIQNGKILPGLELFWEEGEREEELGQIDGWLTSACTLK